MTRVIRADQHGPRVVPALVVDASAHATAILARANDRARALVAAAEAAADEVAAVAQRAGQQRAQLQVQAELASAVQALAQVREQMLATQPAQLIELSMEAAQHIVGSELSTRPEAIEAIVRPLLSRLRRAQSMVVHLHPEDAAWLEAAPALHSELGVRALLRFEPDPEVTRGGCVVSSEIGALDARIESRLDVVARALKQSARPHGE